MLKIFFKDMLFSEKINNFAKRRYRIERCSVSQKDCVSGTVGIFVAASLVFFMVATIVFALYEFVHVSGISDIAGVHVTAPLKNAANEMLNGKGDEGWLVYRNSTFQLEYPMDWSEQASSDGEHLLSLKKYNGAANQGSDSLVAAIFVNVEQVADNASIKDVISGKGIEWSDDWQQAEFGGKPGIRTGEIKTNSGIVKDIIFWKFNDKVYSLEGDFLNAELGSAKDTFEKVVNKFKFF